MEMEHFFQYREWFWFHRFIVEEYTKKLTQKVQKKKEGPVLYLQTTRNYSISQSSALLCPFLRGLQIDAQYKRMLQKLLSAPPFTGLFL